MPPDFIIVQESGPDHKKHFIMKVSAIYFKVIILSLKVSGRN